MEFTLKFEWQITFTQSAIQGKYNKLLLNILDVLRHLWLIQWLVIRSHKGNIKPWRLRSDFDSLLESKALDFVIFLCSIHDLPLSKKLIQPCLLMRSHHKHDFLLPNSKQNRKLAHHWFPYHHLKLLCFRLNH